jgi:hypothetical protein
MGPGDLGRERAGSLDQVVELRPGGDRGGGHATIKDFEGRAETASCGAVSHGFL